MRMSAVLVVAVLVVLMAGCGGSGEQAADGLPPPAIGGEPLEIGPMIVRTEKTAEFKADSIPGNSDCSFMALYGAQVNYLASTAMLDRVVFSSDRGGAHNIHISNLDGNGLTQLTNNSAVEFWPRWSPDGTKIAFVRQWPGQNPVICTMNADGSGMTALTDNSIPRVHPEWAPTGGHIAYTAEDSGILDVHFMYADGSQQQPLETSLDDDFMPAWSPDNMQIAFCTTRYGPYSQIAVTKEDAPVARLTHSEVDDLAPSWHPLGAEICFFTERIGDEEVYIMDSNGDNPRIFTASPGHNVHPRYSTDGRYITFTSGRSGNADIWIQETATGPTASLVGPVRAWNVTNHSAEDLQSDLGSPTVQTDRVLIGPAGSDRGGSNPIWSSAPAAIVAFDREGYRNLVRVGIATEHLASMQVNPFDNPGGDVLGVEVSATRIANLRQDAGWGNPPTVWSFSGLNPGMVILYFHGHTGKLVSAIPVEDSVYTSDATTEPKEAHTTSVEADGVRLTGDFPAVFDAEGNNLAPNGASSVRLSHTGEVLAVN